MKSVLLYVLTPLITFSLGVGFDQLTSRRSIKATPTVITEPAREVIPADVPVPAEVRVEAPAPMPKPTLILDNPTRIYGTHSGFFILGPKPKEFANFDFIELTLSEHGGANFVSLYENSGDSIQEYHASIAFVSNRKLFIVTSKGSEAGFEYRFDGEFIRTDFLNIAGKQKVALRGTLTKTKDGRTIAERVVSFYMDYLGC